VLPMSAADKFWDEVHEMTLQPLVENTIRHGKGRKTAGAILTAVASRRNGRLFLRMTDVGGFHTWFGKESTGIGLSNGRARVLELHDSNFGFSIVPLGQETRASVRIHSTSARVCDFRPHNWRFK